MFETVGDGSPISPVFDCPEKLANYLANNPWGACNSSYDDWLAMIRKGWCPSAGSINGKFMSGVEFVAQA